MRNRQNRSQTKQSKSKKNGAKKTIASNKNKSMDKHIKHLSHMIPLMVCCAFFSILLYVRTLWYSFTLDDLSAIKRNPVLRPQSPLWKVFVTDIWGVPLTSKSSHFSYRPLTVLTLRANFFFSGLDPFLYHLINVIMYAIVCACVVPFLLRELTISKGSIGTWPLPYKMSYNVFFSFVVAFVFTFHPIHTECVANVQNRAEILCAFFSFSAFNIYTQNMGHRYSNVVTLKFSLLIICSVLCKETGLMTTVVCAVNDISTHILPNWFGRKKRENKLKNDSSTISACIRRVMFLAILSVIYLIFRKFVFFSNTPMPSEEDNPLLFHGSTTRLRTALYLQVRYAWLLLFPKVLSSDYSYNAIPLIESWYDTRLVLVVLYALILLCIILRAWYDVVDRNDRRLVLGLAWLYLPLFPASHIFVIGTVIAERLLFIPCIGYAILLGYFFEKILGENPNAISQKLKKIRSIRRRCSRLRYILVCTSFFLGLLLYSGRTIVRNEDWQDNIALSRSQYRDYPNSIKACSNMASISMNLKNFDDAIRYNKEALAIQSLHPSSLMLLSQIYKNSAAHKNLSLAMTYINGCIQNSKNSLQTSECFYLQGSIWNDKGDFKKCAESLDRSEKYQHVTQAGQCFHADCLGGANRLKESIDKYRTCFEIHAAAKKDPYALHWVNFARALLWTGQVHEAKEKLNIMLSMPNLEDYDQFKNTAHAIFNEAERIQKSK